MKPPSVPAEEKWTVRAPAEEPELVAPTGEEGTGRAATGGAGAGAPRAWVPNGHGRRPAPVEPSDRQRLAVEAYCRELCPSDEVPAATAEALATFGVTAVRLGQKATSADHERVLSRATRNSAASHALVGASGSGWRSRVVDALTAERDVGCRVVPALLARRGNGELAAGEAAALDDHLHDCLRCRATELRMARAERMFTAASRLGVAPPGLTGAVVPEGPVADAAVADAAVAWASAGEAAVGEAAVGEAAVREVSDADVPAPFADAPAAAADSTWIPPELTPKPTPPVTEPAPTSDWEAVPVAATASLAGGPPPPTDHPPAHHPPGRARRRVGPIPVAAAVGLLAAGGVATAAVLGSGSAHHAKTPAASIPSTPSVSAPVASAPVRQLHSRHVVHRRVHRKPNPKPKPKPVTSTITSTSATTTGNTGNTGSVGSTGNTGAVTPAPTVSSSPPVASSPPASSGGGGSSGGSSGSSATIQQPSLGATNAPTQGIGNKH